MKKIDFELKDETFEKIINLGMDDLMEMLKENPKFKAIEVLLKTIPEEKDFIKTLILDIVTSNPTTSALFTHIATETLINIIIAKISVENKKESEEKDEHSN